MYFDTYVHRQGTFFWIDDMSVDTNNEVIPKKRRIWLVVSNNEINNTSANLSVVPVYTRSEATKNTHVAFKNGDRDCVIVCEDIMTVPRSRIKPSNYAGVCSQELWAKVHKAILNQFQDNVTISNVSNTVTSLITNEEFKNTIIDAVITLYNKQVMPTKTKTTNSNNNKNSNTNISMTINTNKRRKKHMNIETSKDWFSDSFTMSLDELNAKYSDYGIIDDKSCLERRRRYMKAKLQKLERATV